MGARFRNRRRQSAAGLDIRGPLLARLEHLRDQLTSRDRTLHPEFDRAYGLYRIGAIRAGHSVSVIGYEVKEWLPGGADVDGLARYALTDRNQLVPM